jgi:transcriptional regulator GlxA family with amidase domain
VHLALDHIDRHLGCELRIADIAELCGYSVDHFIRRFRRAVGQTPSDYLTERRIATASQLLVFTDLTIDEVAERTGYRNRYYFSRVFARRMGTPPARYRRVEV